MRTMPLQDDLSDMDEPVIQWPTPVATPPSPAPGPQPTAEIPLPAAAAFGWLGEHARTLGAPLEWAYPAALAAFSSLPINLSDPFPTVRTNLYVVLVAAPEQGKSVSMTRTLRSLDLDVERVHKTVPSSDRGLAKVLAPPAPVDKKAPAISPQLLAHLLVPDEFRTLLSKMQIRGAALASTLCSLWNDDEAGAATKEGVHGVYARLSLLSGLAVNDPDEYSELMGSETMAGLESRLIVCPGPEGWRWDHTWRPDPEIRKPSQVDIPASAFQAVQAWRDQKPGRGRLGENALRIALISAAANHDSSITEECLAAALAFAEWQERVKSVYTATPARNDDAQLTHAMLAAIKAENDREDEAGGWVKFRTLANNKHWVHKYGSPLVTRVKRSLIDEGMLVAEFYPDDKTGEDSRKPTGRVRLAGNHDA